MPDRAVLAIAVRDVTRLVAAEREIERARRSGG
jgi:hypothetical protein